MGIIIEKHLCSSFASQVITFQSNANLQKVLSQIIENKILHFQSRFQDKLKEVMDSSEKLEQSFQGTDNGTGQAKIYAEREAALLLLGGRLDVTAIEEGAWEMEGGVFFQPAIPASSFLMQCIKDATFTARRRIAESKLNKKKESDKEDLPSTFSLLPTDAKAEYLLHQYCRQWYQFNHSRKMDLFCRCKPLSEDVTTVNQTGINIAKAMIAKVGLDYCNSQTASLPPLKLTLEDACLASEESYDDHISGWNHFSSQFI